MLYHNTKTGSSIETDCEVSGGDWEEVKDKKQAQQKKAEPASDPEDKESK